MNTSVWIIRHGKVYKNEWDQKHRHCVNTHKKLKTSQRHPIKSYSKIETSSDQNQNHNHASKGKLTSSKHRWNRIMEKWYQTTQVRNTWHIKLHI